MTKHRSSQLASLIVVASTLLAACGGGSDSPTPAPVVPLASTLQGTAAVGSALANGQVSVVNGAGASPCQEASIVTTGAGAYLCTLKAGETAPFFVSVTDPSGIVPTLVSVTTQTPTAGTPLVLNATPLTTAILAQLAVDRNALTVFNSRAIDASALVLATTNVVAQLQTVLASIAAPAGYNPFTTSITAASAAGSGNTADLLLEVVKIGTDTTGRLTLGTVDNPSGVPMASATQTGAIVPAVSAGVASLSRATQALSLKLAECYALPVAQRVLATDTTIAATQGGNKVTQMAAPCLALTDPAYLQNGFSAGQSFYGILTSSSMTGARFNVPEIMQMIPAAISELGFDAAVLNVRFADANGAAANFIVVAVNKGTGTATPNWVVFGNQQPVNVLVRSSIRQQQQLAPVAQAPFNTTATLSTYQTGIEFYIDKDGPGSANLTAARVKGPGLPAPGLVLNRPTTAFEPQQSWLNIANKTGGSPAALATQPNNCNCDIFWLQRTQDFTGAGASTLRNNPNGGNSNSAQFLDWAHPLDYGAALGTPSDQYVPLAAFATGARYTVELFYSGSATATYTLTKTLLSPMIPATRGSFLAWNAPTAATLNILDPANALAVAAASFPVGWTQNPSAEQIRLVQMFNRNGATTVNQGNGIGVPRGATSVVVTAPSGLQFPPLDSTGNSGRVLQFTYRTFDNSLKLSIHRFN